MARAATWSRVRCACGPEEDEDGVDSSYSDGRKEIKEPESILKKGKAESCLPGPSTSILKNPSASVPSESCSVMKFRAKVTTLEEIIKSQNKQHDGQQSIPISMSGRLPGLRPKTNDFHASQSKSVPPPSVVITGPTSSDYEVEAVPLNLDNPLSFSGSRCKTSAKRTRTPTVVFNEPSDHDNELTLALAVDEPSDSPEQTSCCCCCSSPWYSGKGCCGWGSRDTSGTSRASRSGMYWRDGWERLSSRLPSWLLSLLGFITKIYWRLIDSVMGVETPYRDENGEGNHSTYHAIQS